MLFNFAGCAESTTIIKDVIPRFECRKTECGRLYFQFNVSNQWNLAIQITESIDDSPCWFAIYQYADNMKLPVTKELESYVQNIVDVFRSGFGIEFGKYFSLTEQRMRNVVRGNSFLTDTNIQPKTMEIIKDSIISLRRDSAGYYYVCLRNKIMHKYLSRQCAEEEYDYLLKDIEFFVKNRWNI